VEAETPAAAMVRDSIDPLVPTMGHASLAHNLPLIAEKCDALLIIIIKTREYDSVPDDQPRISGQTASGRSPRVPTTAQSESVATPPAPSREPAPSAMAAITNYN
jgi:hypothetical protein